MGGRGRPPHTLRAFAFEPYRSTMFAETSWSSWIDAFGEVQWLGILLRAQRGQHALRREWGFVQADSDCIVNCVGDCRDGRSERSFAAFFCSEWAFGIDALDYDRLDFGRFD